MYVFHRMTDIKRALDDFFQLCRSKDFRHRPGAVRFYDILLKQSKIERASDGSFFGNAVRAFFQIKKTPEGGGDWPDIGGDRPDIGRRMDRDRTARARNLSDVLLPSGYRPVIEWIMLSFAFNHLYETDVSITSLRIMNYGSQVGWEKDTQGSCNLS